MHVNERVFQRLSKAQRWHAHVAATSMFRDPILPPHYVVQATAQEFLTGGMPDVALIFAQTACEIAMDVMLEDLFRHRRLPEAVESWIRSRMPESAATFNNDHLYKLYRALSGDALRETRLWQDWKPLIDVRNKVVHSGGHATDEQAKRYCDLALEVIHHFEAVRGHLT